MHPVRQPHKSLADIDETEAILHLGQLRATFGRIEQQLRRRSIDRAALEAVRDQIDDLALLVAGRRDSLHTKPHSDAGR